MGLANLFIAKQNILILDDSKRTPATYTIATGLVIQEVDGTDKKLYGAWNYDVSDLHYGTTEEMNERFVSFIQDKLREYGVFGYIEFLFNKMRWVTSEGFFGWLTEGGGNADFFDPEANILRSILYPNGRFYAQYLYAANGLWIVIFFGMCIAMLMPCFTGFGEDRLRCSFDLFLRLTVFFGIAVILFTEGRPRYLISFMPVYCLVSVSGYSYVAKLFRGISKTGKGL